MSMSWMRWANWVRKARAPIAGLILLAAMPGSTASAESQPGKGTETVDLVISPLRSNQGNIFVAVYERPGWLVPGRFRTYRTVPARAGGVSVHIPGVPRGRVAVAVFHDENRNGRVDKNWLGLPAEGFGFSRLTPLRVPSFDEVSFPSEAGDVTHVKMRY